MLSVISRTFEVTKTEVSFFTDEYQVRWAQAKDIFQGLELSITNVTATLERHVFPEYRRQFAIGRGQPAWYITQKGVIQLGMMAKSQFAQSFQRWVFDVIDEVVRTGQYTAKASDDQYLKPIGLKLMHRVDYLTERLEAELKAREPGTLPSDLVAGFGVAIGATRRSASKADQFKKLIELCDKPCEPTFFNAQYEIENAELIQRISDIKAVVKSLMKEDEQD